MRWVDLKARKRVEELQDDLDKLKRGLQDIQLEWNNVYDKLRSMMGRIAKRAERTENANPLEQPGGDATPSSSPESVVPGMNGLTARQKSIQASILARRRQFGRPQ